MTKGASGSEPLKTEAFVAQASVDTPMSSVLPGLSGSDASDVDPCPLELEDTIADEPGTIVGPQCLQFSSFTEEFERSLMTCSAQDVGA
jgi:hypothetical protein